MSNDLRENLLEIVGKEHILNDSKRVEDYLEDESPEGSRVEPASDVLVVKPANAEEVSEVIRLSNEYESSVFVQGGATGLVGGSVPTKSGLVLSMERLNHLEIDRDNLTATVGAGVTLKELIETARENGLFFPLHPGDEDAQVGGLVACNAGGSRAVKTGVMRNYVRGLEVVLPPGEMLNIGGKLIKDNADADKLMNFFVGTEGIFGVITEAVLKILPSEGATATLVAPFEDKFGALDAIPEILRSGVVPQGLEYVERRTIEGATRELGVSWPAEVGEAYLLLMFSEFDETTLFAGMEKVSEILDEFGSLDPLLAELSDEESKILRIRSELYPFLKPNLYEDLDVCVPISELSDFLLEIDKISEKYDTYLHPYGHGGDGNIHIHVMKQEGWSKEDYESIVKQIYKAGVELGGTISGEHGIGESKKKFLKYSMGSDSVHTIKRLKRTFDPKNILNPGKLIDFSD
ncbi:hypothetical protein AKJ64_01520 [candidate division MSBL1 archaeon SCGC-AAA259E17]|uniref:FAD-binding PCMH-type domain-containing protein n=1 Tax=candidate division MSBL1 archaeon SCGC-AAA259E17 TaxID=1698263 RepID=A0A133UFU7_9EURY|nr:hypothetical protein AKJ64_01520 [candidate division MSBL1 archaeon SCGC-AAA259E17]